MKEIKIIVCDRCGKHKKQSQWLDHNGYIINLTPFSYFICDDCYKIFKRIIKKFLRTNERKSML